jgi:hypothetical protein
MDILVFIFGGVITVMFLIVIGGSFREWNIGKDNLRKRHESGLTPILKALVYGIIIAIIYAIIFA